MTKTIDHLIKNLQKSEQLVTHQEVHSTTRVSQFCCSCFIKQKNLLVKGELLNPDQNQRNALLLFIDPETNQVKGSSKPHKLTRRPGPDVEPRESVVSRLLRVREADLCLGLGEPGGSSGRFQGGRSQAERLHR